MNVYDLVVKLSGDGQGLRDDLAQDRAAVDALLGSLDDKDITIDLDTAEASVKLDELDGKMSELQDAVAYVDLSDSDAKAKLDELRIELDSLRDAHSKLEIDDAAAKAKIVEIDAKMKEIRDAHIRILVDTAGAQAKIDALEAEKLPDKTIDVKADTTSVDADIERIRAELEALKAERAKIDIGVKEEDLPSVRRENPKARTLHSIISTLRGVEQDLGSVSSVKNPEFRAKNLLYSLALAKQAIDRLRAGEEGVNPEASKLAVEKAQSELRAVSLPSEIKPKLSQPDVAKVRTELDAEIPDHKTVHVEVEEGSGSELLSRLFASKWGKSRGKSGGGSGSRGGGSFLGAFSAGGRRASTAGILALLGGVVPMVAPVGGAAVGGGMGLLSALAPGAAGAIGVAAVTHHNVAPVTQAVSAYNRDMKAASQATTIKQQNADIAKAEAAFNDLDAAQRKAATSLQQFEGFWNKFATSFQNPVLTMFENGLKTLQNLLTGLKPAINGAAQAFGELENDASKALGGPFWQSFFKYLGSNSETSILEFGHAIGNLAKGFAGLLMAFQPLSREMGRGLVSLTQKFANWATHLQGTKGFEQFLKYASQSGKDVLSLIGNLARLAGTLLKDMAPLGLVMIEFVSDLAKWINQLLEGNPIIKFLVGLLFQAAKGLLEVADGIVKFFMWLQKTHPVLMKIITAVGVLVAAFFAFTNPIGLVIAAVAAFGLAANELIKHWKQIKPFFEKLWKWAETETKKVWGSIEKFFEKLWKSISAAIKKAWDAIKKWFVDLWKTMAADLTKAWRSIEKFFSNLWKNIKTDASRLWHDIKSTLSKSAESAYKGITDVFGKLGAYFKGLWKDAKSWGAGIINNIAKGLENAWNTLKTKAENIARSIGHLFGFGGGQVHVSSNVGNMVHHTGTVQHVYSGSVTHTHAGTVDWGKPSKQSVRYIGQELFRDGYARGVRP